MKVTHAVFILLVLFLAFIPAWAILSLDEESLRAQVEAQIQAQAGVRVTIDETGFRLFPFPALELKGIKFFDTLVGPVFEAPSGQVKLAFRPLWKGKAVIHKVFFRQAEIRLERRSGGRWAWLPSALAPKGESAPEDAGTFLQALYIEKSTLFFRDETASPPFETVLRDVDLLIMPADTGLVWQVDLSAKAPEKTGRIFFTGLYDRQQDILFFRAADEQEKMTFEGALLSLIYLPVFEGEAGFSGIEGSVGKGGGVPFLEGAFSAELEGSFRGTHPAEISGAILAEGAVDIRNGRMNGVNLVRSVVEETLNRLDLSSGKPLSPPEELSRIYDAEGTGFESLQGDVSILEQKVSLADALIRHPQYMIELQGNYMLSDREVDMQGRVILLEPLSRYVAEIHEVFNSFRNEAGRVVIPFRLTGLFPSAVVKPDMDYIRAFIRDQNINAGESAPAQEEVANAAGGRDRNGQG